MRIAILALPGVQMLNLAGPMDVFSAANRLLGGADAYSVEIVGPTMAPIVAENGARILPDASIATDLRDVDTLLVAGGPTFQDGDDLQDAVDWISRASRQVRRLGSLCTAALLLAKAGVLDGRRATTHWKTTANMTAAFPAIRLDPDRIYVKDGALYTSAGVTAGLDLALALVEEDHGSGLALQVAKELILFLMRPGGQPQVSVHLAAQLSGAGPVRDLQEWVLAHVGEDLSIEALAVRSHMSTRNFTRLFKRETGVTPGDFVATARVEAARRLLEAGDSPLKKVATLSGFADQSGLRRAFIRHVGVAPFEYRRRLRGP
jgi:transcriptional regulator GlxA family with amidase domain